MDSYNISEILNELAKGKNRSATARLREIFDEIEVALQAGVRRKDVYGALIKSGFAISFESFELAIYRIRKERSKRQKYTETKPPAPSTPAKQTAGTNPLRALSGKPKDGVFNPIPTAKFEIDNT